MAEINLMEKYPKSKRKVEERGDEKTPEDQAIARKFGKDFFDGDRKVGYGGYSYNERFWKDVVQDFIKHYDLKDGSKILDIGCGKGFMVFDLKKANPNLDIQGFDISEYAIENCQPEVKELLSVGDARDLSKYGDKEFDLVISITTVHNLEREECKKCLQEIERIGKNAFITLDAWRNEEEEERRMKRWNLTALTFMSTDDWKKFFEEAGYTGDYWWFIP